MHLLSTLFCHNHQFCSLHPPVIILRLPLHIILWLFQTAATSINFLHSTRTIRRKTEKWEFHIHTRSRRPTGHIDAIMPTVRIALWTLTFVSIFLYILLGVLLLAVIALLITVNPVLERERKALVTLVLRGWLTGPRLLVGASTTSAAPRQEVERSERTAPRSAKRTITANGDKVHF